jgi:hypothetical protein
MGCAVKTAIVCKMAKLMSQGEYLLTWGVRRLGCAG